MFCCWHPRSRSCHWCSSQFLVLILKTKSTFYLRSHKSQSKLLRNHKRKSKPRSQTPVKPERQKTLNETPWWKKEHILFKNDPAPENPKLSGLGHLRSLTPGQPCTSEAANKGSSCKTRVIISSTGWIKTHDGYLWSMKCDGITKSLPISLTKQQRTASGCGGFKRPNRYQMSCIDRGQRHLQDHSWTSKASRNSNWICLENLQWNNLVRSEG